jgi:hypothetical protein
MDLGDEALLGEGRVEDVIDVDGEDLEEAFASSGGDWSRKEEGGECQIESG